MRRTACVHSRRVDVGELSWCAAGCMVSDQVENFLRHCLKARSLRPVHVVIHHRLSANVATAWQAATPADLSLKAVSARCLSASRAIQVNELPTFGRRRMPRGGQLPPEQM